MEPIITVHVSRLPREWGQREFEALFAFAPGFERASFKFDHIKGTAAGWARFASEETTDEAIRILDGYHVDDHHVLRCSRARNNLTIPRGGPNNTNMQPQHSQLPLQTTTHHPPTAGKRDRLEYEHDATLSTTITGLPPTKYMRPTPPTAASAPRMMSQPTHSVPLVNTLMPLVPTPPTTATTNAPAATTTLHIAGVPATTTEQEARLVFQGITGFQAMRYVPPRAPGRGPTIFLKFLRQEFAEDAIAVIGGVSLAGELLSASFAREELDLSRLREF